MKISLFPNSSARNSKPVLDAFANASRHRGHHVHINSLDCDVAVIWSQLWAGRMAPNHAVFQHYISKNRPVIFLEIGVIDRGRTWRLMPYNMHYQPIRNQDHVRAANMGLTLAPWRLSGDAIMLCLQRTESLQWQGMPDVKTWVSRTVHELRQYTDRPILIRPHPRQSWTDRVPGTEVVAATKLPDTYDSFNMRQALDNIWAVINWNSNPGIEAVLAGIPAFVGCTSRAAPVANLKWQRIENPLMPDRQQWLNDLAWTEWSLEEIDQGIPFDRLQMGI